MNRLTLGSLFSGSGGFELAGSLFGIEPLWESEIEPLPIRVTERNFPNCLKLGNIAAIHGWSIPKVDIITGGSPCQDMSIAGKRDGLAGERSCLFNEQIRIVKEMREDDRNAGRTGADIRPRWMCWENVPGAFTSNQRQDFQAVLTEIIRIAEPEAPAVPIPPKGWPTAGCFMGEHGEWSVAYRVLDAKCWGVPQRRKRIYLVADFAGESAAEILLERNGLSGDFAESRQAWEETAGHPKNFPSAPSSQRALAYSFDSLASNSMKSSNPFSGCRLVDCAKTLDTTPPDPSKNQGGIAILQPIVLDNHPADSRITLQEDGIVQTLTSRMRTGGGNVPMVMEPMSVHQNQLGEVRMGTVANTLNTNSNATGRNSPLVAEPKVFWWHSKDDRLEGPMDVSNTIDTRVDIQGRVMQPIPINDKATRYQGGGDTRNGDGAGNGLGIGQPGDPSPTLTAADRHGVAYCLQGSMIGRADKNGPQGDGVNADVSFTLNTVDRHCVAYAIDRAALNQGANAQYDISVQSEISQTLVAKGPNAVAQPLTVPEISGILTAKMAKGTGGPAGDEMQNLVAEYPEYIVRRFTPLECCRLQGFPDWWAEQLGVEEPTDGMVDRWLEIFKTHWELVTSHDGVKAPKTRSQVIKWLKDPASDSSLYKMWGNGIALPCAAFVMEGIANQNRKE